MVFVPEMTMRHEDYIKACVEKNDQNPNWRWGQTLFNVLLENRPDLAELIRGNDELDPFYALPYSKKIKDFLNWVEANWEPQFNNGAKQPNILDIVYWKLELNPPQFDGEYYLEDCKKWLENNNPWNKNENIQ